VETFGARFGPLLLLLLDDDDDAKIQVNK